MNWKKVPPEPADFLDGFLEGFNCDKRKMSGSPVYFVNGNMFAGVHQGSIFLRLSEEDRKLVLGECDGAVPSELLKGRIMKE